MADEIKDGKVDVTRYMVKEGEKVNLKKYSTKCDVSIDKSQVKNLYFPQVIEKLKDLQEKLYARQGRYDQSCLCKFESWRCEGGFLQAADYGGKRPRLHVAYQ